MDGALGKKVNQKVHFLQENIRNWRSEITFDYLGFNLKEARNRTVILFLYKYVLLIRYFNVSFCLHTLRRCSCSCKGLMSMSLALIVRQSFIVSQSKTFAFLVQVSLKRKTIVFLLKQLFSNLRR